MRAAPVVLIGVGNTYRRDDGVAPALLERIARDRPPGVELVLSDGEPSSLLDAWTGRELAVVVDAVACEPARPGRIHRTSETGLEPGAAGGSHALGVPDAVRLARVLDRLPARLVVYAVEVADLGFGTGLSADVAAAVPALEKVVRAEIRNRM